MYSEMDIRRIFRISTRNFTVIIASKNATYKSMLQLQCGDIKVIGTPWHCIFRRIYVDNEEKLYW